MSCCCPRCCCWCHCSHSSEHLWRSPKTFGDDCWIALWWELQRFDHSSWTFLIFQLWFLLSRFLYSSECIRSQEASGDVFDLTWPFYKKIFYWLYSKINVYLFFFFWWDCCYSKFVSCKRGKFRKYFLSGLEPEDVTISFPIILFVNSFNNTLQSVCWEKN